MRSQLHARLHASRVPNSSTEIKGDMPIITLPAARPAAGAGRRAEGSLTLATGRGPTALRPPLAVGPRIGERSSDVPEQG